MAGNQIETVSTSKFNRAQNEFIAQKMKEVFTCSALYRKLYPHQQTIGLEALLFQFNVVPFEYKIETIVEKDDKGKEFEIKKYIFTFVYQVVGVTAKNTLIEAEIKVDKNFLDRTI